MSLLAGPVRRIDVRCPPWPANRSGGTCGCRQDRGHARASRAQRHRSMIWTDPEYARQLVRADPGRLTRGPEPILIDEWQSLPAVDGTWCVERVDTGTPGRAASSSPVRSRRITPLLTHSGAGRIEDAADETDDCLHERGSRQEPTVSLTAPDCGGDRPPIDGLRPTSTLEGSRRRDRRAGGFPGCRSAEARAQRDDGLRRLPAPGRADPTWR